MYFSAWWISARPRPATANESLFYTLTGQVHAPSVNATVAPDNSTVAAAGAIAAEPASPLARLIAHPRVRALSKDIFTGQIIATLIVLAFIAVFLLREWISQNARPGVFEDPDLLAEELRVAQEERMQLQVQVDAMRAGGAREEREREAAALPVEERPMRRLPLRARRRAPDADAPAPSGSEDTANNASTATAPLGIASESKQAQLEADLMYLEQNLETWNPPDHRRLEEQNDGGKGKGRAMSEEEEAEREEEDGERMMKWIPPSVASQGADARKASAATGILAPMPRPGPRRTVGPWLRRTVERQEMERLGIADAFAPAPADAAQQAHFHDLGRQFLMRRRLLYERLRDESLAKGEEPLAFPEELVDVQLDDPAWRALAPPDTWPPLAEDAFVLPAEPPSHGAHTPHPHRARAPVYSRPRPVLPPASTDPAQRARTADALADGSFSFAPPPQFAARLAPSPSYPPLPYPIVASPPPPVSSASASTTASPPSSSSLSPSPSTAATPGPPSPPRRPPMPGATLPAPTTPPTPLLAAGSHWGKGQVPLASPSLATYRAPEEFQQPEAEDYFEPGGAADAEDDVDTVAEGDGMDGADEDEDPTAVLRREHARYFREQGHVAERDGDVPTPVVPSDSEDDDEEEEVMEVIPRRAARRRAAWDPAQFDGPEQMDDDDEGELDEVEGEGEGEGGRENGQALEPVDDMDINVEDDMDGALEGVSCIFRFRMVELRSLTPLRSHRHARADLHRRAERECSHSVFSLQAG